MSTLIQVRNVPEETGERLKARAAAAGKSLNSYMLEIIEREVGSPTKAEILDRIMARGPLVGPEAPSGAELIRELRDERSQYWLERAQGLR